MYKSSLLFLCFFILTLNLQSQEAVINKEAPNFILTDSYGKVHELSNYRGSYIVLEWINYECPFVKKHYNSGNMQALQKKYTEKDVVWLAICSSANGKQGNFSPAEINEKSGENNAHFTAYLIDETGMTGKSYNAKTTPHMFIINPEGILVYTGGIDDKPSTNIDDIKNSFNYLDAALTSAMNGKEIQNQVTQPYGCSVKY